MNKQEKQHHELTAVFTLVGYLVIVGLFTFFFSYSPFVVRERKNGIRH